MVVGRAIIVGVENKYLPRRTPALLLDNQDVGQAFVFGPGRRGGQRREDCFPDVGSLMEERGRWLAACIRPGELTTILRCNAKHYGG